MVAVLLEGNLLQAYNQWNIMVRLDTCHAYTTLHKHKRVSRLYGLGCVVVIAYCRL